MVEEGRADGPAAVLGRFETVDTKAPGGSGGGSIETRAWVEYRSY